MKMPSQSVRMAMEVAKRMKAKKMSGGGFVEPEPMEDNAFNPNLKENYSEKESEFPDVSGEGFELTDIDGHSEEDDMDPQMFAYGGPVEPEDEDMASMPYPEFKEVNDQMESGLKSKPMRFMSKYMASRAMKNAKRG